MIAGLRGWERLAAASRRTVGTIAHDGWSVEARRAPLGVVGFVFEGRPNVFADAAGVVRTGNTRRDAHRLRRARHRRGDRRARRGAGAGRGRAARRARSRSSGRGRGPPAGRCSPTADWRSPSPVARAPAVAQLGAVARQAGTPVSLHGTGGAWLVAGARRRRRPVRRQRDATRSTARCATRSTSAASRRRGPPSSCPRFLDAVDAAAAALRHVGPAPRRRRPPSLRAGRAVHDEGDRSAVPTATASSRRRRSLDRERPRHGVGVGGLARGRRCVVTESVDEAVALHNAYSPRFIASLISDDVGEQRALLRRRRRPVRRRRLHPLGRRPVRPRHARARPVELAVRPPARARRRAVRRLDPHHPPPGHDRRPHLRR